VLHLVGQLLIWRGLFCFDVSCCLALLVQFVLRNNNNNNNNNKTQLKKWLYREAKLIWLSKFRFQSLKDALGYITVE